MVSGLTIPFNNVYDEDEWNADQEVMDEEIGEEVINEDIDEDNEWSKDETIQDLYYNFDDNLTEMIENDDEPLISDLIRRYIWNDICKKKYKLLKMFKIMYEETEQISFTFYTKSDGSGRFNYFGYFELWNDITDEFNYFVMEDWRISTSSQMSHWIGELYEEFEDQKRDQAEWEEVVIIETIDRENDG